MWLNSVLCCSQGLESAKTLSHADDWLGKVFSRSSVWPLLGFSSLTAVGLSSQFFAGQRQPLVLYEVILSIRTKEGTENVQQDKSHSLQQPKLRSGLLLLLLYAVDQNQVPRSCSHSRRVHKVQLPEQGSWGASPTPPTISPSPLAASPVTDHHLPSKNSHYFRCRQMQHILREPGFCSTAHSAQEDTLCVVGKGD